MASTLYTTSAAAARPGCALRRSAACRPLNRRSSLLPPLPRACETHKAKALEVLGPLAALDIDWSDPDTRIGAAGALLGLALGLGIPIFFVQREKIDEERLEELRALNRQTFKETGEYLSPVSGISFRSPGLPVLPDDTSCIPVAFQEEIEAIRPPRWTDRRCTDPPRLPRRLPVPLLTPKT